MVFNTETAGELFCSPEHSLTVTGYPLIYCYCDELNVLPRGKESGEEEEKGGTVLTSAESNCQTISGADHPPEYYCICYPLFNLGSEMMTAEVTM